MTVMTHVKALQAGHSSQGTSEPITPVCRDRLNKYERMLLIIGAASFTNLDGMSSGPVVFDESSSCRGAWMGVNRITN